MTVNTTKITSGPYAGNGVASSFNYTFKVDDKTQLSVFETTDSGVETLLVVDTDYTVNDIGVDGGGTIDRTAGALPTDYQWYIRSNYQETQLTAFSSQGPFFPDLHENAMDKLTFLIQQILDTNDRSVRISNSETPVISGVLADVLTRKNKALGFNNIGELSYLSTTDPFVNADFTFNEPTVASMKAHTATDYVAGDYVRCAERNNALFIVVTGVAAVDGYRVISDDDNNLSFVLEDISLSDPKSWGVIADGVVDDTLPLQALFNYAKSTGIRIESDASHNYFLGTFPDDSIVTKFTIDVDGFRWDTNNCTFSANASTAVFHDGLASQNIFMNLDASDTAVGDFKVVASQIARDGSDRQGMHAFILKNSAANSRNLTLGRVLGDKLISVLTVVSDNPTSFRHRGITFTNLFNDGGYYGLNCANNGDGINGYIHCNDCIRSYFVYGVEDHKVHTRHTNHLKFTDIVIARLSRDTKHIKVFCDTDSLSSSGVVSLEHQTDDTDAIISDIDISFNVTVSNPANPTFKFNALNAAGTPQTTTTNVFNNIKVRGESNSTNPVQFNTAMLGESQSIIDISKQLLKGVTDTKRFNVDFGNRRTVFADATNDLSLRFNVSDLKFTPSWGKLRVWAADNPTASAAEYYAAEYWVLFSVASDGSVNILTTTLDGVAFTAGVAGVSVSFPNQVAGSFTFEAKVNNYTNANRVAKATLELLTGIKPW